jgi:hypothetical protein
MRQSKSQFQTVSWIDGKRECIIATLEELRRIPNKALTSRSRVSRPWFKKAVFAFERPWILLAD